MKTLQAFLIESRSILSEAKGSGYDDENATASLWNHTAGHPKKEHFLKSPDHIKAEIEKARKDKKHPLNFHNATEGFTGGKKAEHEETYYNELHHAAHTVHHLATHPVIGKAFKDGQKARVTGSESGQLSDTWKSSGAKNKTSKADMIIGGNHGDKHYHTISLKKGDSQLMSAQPEEIHATYKHATEQLKKSDKSFSADHQKKVLSKIVKVKKHLSAMASSSTPEEQRTHRDAGQHLINSIHKEHPNLLAHVHREAATGHGKFGEGKQGTARFLVTSHKNGAHIHDTETGKEPIAHSIPRVSLPKGSGRPGNVKVDYKAVKE